MRSPDNGQTEPILFPECLCLKRDEHFSFCFLHAGMIIGIGLGSAREIMQLKNRNGSPVFAIMGKMGNFWK